MDCLIVELLDPWIIRLLDHLIVESSNHRIGGSLDRWIGGLFYCWIVYRTIGPLNHWMLGSLDCCIDEALDRYIFDC